MAGAAGIGRTTLHRQYATRDDLMRAVAHRAIDVWEQAVGAETGGRDPDGGLRALITAMVQLGPQLAFLWRTPAFDDVTELRERIDACKSAARPAPARAGPRRHSEGHPGLVADGAVYAVIYRRARVGRDGSLAPRDAPDLGFGTFLRGAGAAPQG